jgi:hypothetical protein
MLERVLEISDEIDTQPLRIAAIEGLRSHTQGYLTMRNTFFRMAAAAVTAISMSFGLASVGSAATFAGFGTLQTSDDLTLINTNGVQLQFLNLQATTNLSSSAAVAAFASDGFSLATLDQVNILFAAFGIDPFPAPAAGVLDRFNVAETADVAGLRAAIGTTNLNSQAIGRVSSGNLVVEVCISTAANCSLRTAWVFGTERAPTAGIGNFLVREAQLAPIPLPASALLLLGGLGGLVTLRRRVRA